MYIKATIKIPWCNVRTCILGAGHSPSQRGRHRLCAGDGVRIELDPEVFKQAQEDHGGWNDTMAEVCVCILLCVLVNIFTNKIIKFFLSF